MMSDIMVDSHIVILTDSRHYFKVDLEVAEAARRIREMRGNDIVAVSIAENMTQLFKCVDIC